MSIHTNWNSQPIYPQYSSEATSSADFNTNSSNPSLLVPVYHDRSQMHHPSLDIPSTDKDLINNYKGNTTEQTPIYNPLSFRQIQHQQEYYQSSMPNSTKTGINNELLRTLEQYLHSYLPGFNPWHIKAAHPIHNQLTKICIELLYTCKGRPLTDKINYFNDAIAEIVMSCATTLGDNSSNYLAPRFELLEIALRSRLYLGLSYGEKSKIENFYNSHKKLPIDLLQTEEALHGFVTKNNFYLSPNPNMYSILTQELLELSFKACISQATVSLPLDSAIDKNEKLIANQLKDLQLSQPSQSSLTFNATLRDDIARKLITKLATQYRKQFQETGTLSRDQILSDCNKLYNFITANNTLMSSLNLFFLLIEETFELLPNNNAPFASIREKISKIKNAPHKQPAPEKKTGLWASLRFGSTQKTMVLPEDLASKQEETINWVERDWQAPLMPMPAPLMEEISYPIIDSREENLNYNPHYPVLSHPRVDTNNSSFLMPTPSAPLMEENLNYNPHYPVLPFPHVDTNNPLLLMPLSSAPSMEENFFDPIPTTTINIVTYPSMQQPAPAAEVITPAIIVPHTDPVAAVQSFKFKADDSKVPVISYVDIAFKELLNRNDDETKWSSLPPIVQKDVLRHVHYRRGLKGKAEELALRIFKNDGWAIYQQATSSNKRYVQAPVTGLQENFVSEGQKLIDFYYSDNILGQFDNFISRFQALPKVPLFYQYVYEMAVAANVHIESWDHNFAEYNWDKPGILHLSMQALERCLHTTPKE